MLRLVVRQILMISEDIDFATANDLVEVFARFDACKKFLSCDCVLQLRFLQLLEKSTDDFLSCISIAPIAYLLLALGYMSKG